MMNNWFILVNPSQFGELKVWFAPTPPNLRLQSTVISGPKVSDQNNSISSVLKLRKACVPCLLPVILPQEMNIHTKKVLQWAMKATRQITKYVLYDWRGIISRGLYIILQTITTCSSHSLSITPSHSVSLYITLSHSVSLSFSLYHSVSLCIT